MKKSELKALIREVIEEVTGPNYISIKESDENVPWGQHKDDWLPGGAGDPDHDKDAIEKVQDQDIPAGSSVVDFAEKLANALSSLGAYTTSMRGVSTMSDLALWKNPKAAVKFNDVESLERAWDILSKKGKLIDLQKTYRGSGGHSVQYIKLGNFLVNKKNDYLGIFTKAVLKNKGLAKHT